MFGLKNYKTLMLLSLISFGHNCRPNSLDELDRAIKVSKLTRGLAATVLLITQIYIFYKSWDKIQELYFPADKKVDKIQKESVEERFGSVAGAYAAKDGLKDIVDYLKDPEKFSRLGAKIPKGILLEGSPGTGKTLLARAVAGEANCAFYSMTGSDFTSKYYGEGAARVRRVFEEARKNGPAILFIDEIDSIGSMRGESSSEILNQLLTCMDGFDTFKKPVIVIAATNRVNTLDEALLRPGRFDRIILVPLPDLQCRTEILTLHMKKFHVDPTVEIAKIACATPGFSGADLTNLINEAALSATKNGKEAIEMIDFNDARDKIIMGAVSTTTVLTEKDRQITAFHEAGHALITLMLPNELDTLHRVTITPRGKSLGVTYSLPEREKYTATKSELLAKITMACGGRVAEELVFGDVTTGAHDDFNKATEIARLMVCKYGMSEEIGLAVYMRDYSLGTAERIDAAVNNILTKCYDRAKSLIIANRDKLDKLANALLEKETMNAGEIYELLGIEPRQDLRLTKP